MVYTVKLSVALSQSAPATTLAAYSSILVFTSRPATVSRNMFSRLLQEVDVKYMHHGYRFFGRSLPSSMPKHRPVPGFDPEKHGEALKAALEPNSKR